MKLNSVSLVTIIGPKTIKSTIIGFLKEVGISGYTYFDAWGGGEDQVMGKKKEQANIQFKILTETILAIDLMQEIAERYFGKEKVIVFSQNADVIRFEKFDKVRY